jgi:(S)-sulfolactate dehydrogenase
MPEVIITEWLEDEYVARLDAFGVHHDPELIHKPEELKALLADGCRGMVVRSGTPVGADVLEAGPGLVAVGRLGVGLDNVDVDAAARLGIAVCNAAGANKHSVAEYTLSAMVQLMRIGVFQNTPRVTGGEWPRYEYIGTEMIGKTLGIIGFGNIGREVARRAQAFGMTLLAVDPYIAGDDPVWAAYGVEKTDLPGVIAACDILTVHVPLTGETRGMVDAAALRSMKPGGFVINTGRGGIVDEAALAASLHNGHTAGAVLDVFDREPLPDATPLKGAPNLIATPHIAGNTAEAMRRVNIMVIDQVAAALKANA